MNLDPYRNESIDLFKFENINVGDTVQFICHYKKRVIYDGGYKVREYFNGIDYRGPYPPDIHEGKVIEKPTFNGGKLLVIKSFYDGVEYQCHENCSKVWKIEVKKNNSLKNKIKEFRDIISFVVSLFFRRGG